MGRGGSVDDGVRELEGVRPRRSIEEPYVHADEVTSFDCFAIRSEEKT